MITKDLITMETIRRYEFGLISHEEMQAELWNSSPDPHVESVGIHCYAYYLENRNTDYYIKPYSTDRIKEIEIFEKELSF